MQQSDSHPGSTISRLLTATQAFPVKAIQVDGGSEFEVVFEVLNEEVLTQSSENLILN